LDSLAQRELMEKKMALNSRAKTITERFSLDHNPFV
jgi:hypothetical protein